MKFIRLIPVFCALALLLSCSKDDDEDQGPAANSLSGTIIYNYTSDVKQIDLKTGTESNYFSYNAYSTNGWDVSLDGKLRLISERPAGTIYETRFMLVSTADGSILNDFVYIPKNGSTRDYAGELSPDNSLILLQPHFDNGIVLLDMNGEEIYHMEGINGKKLTLGDKACWLPGNSLLVRFDDKYLLKADPPYTNLTLVKEMNYEQWGNIRTSRDGKRLSLYIGRHIYLMNIDGTELTQVTESDSGENMAEFSPDGRHLLVGTSYVHAPVSGRSSWNLKIIPADGRKYNMDNSPEVIPVIPAGRSEAVKAGGNTFWRP
ncbi:TolB family protein [Pontibacter beigongshangensis]|uniref:TolB family protein n=1 Tax=Pontibacter beigongshangensis TaxID=2574733 RepID=UPI001650AB83|nr:hypothetical protein [Pontibacter beigongshangensis]